MGARRGRLVAWSTLAGGIGCIAVFVYSSWDWTLERYYAFRLDSGDEPARLQAIRGLGSLDRPTAVDRLLKVAARADERVQAAAVRELGGSRHHRGEVMDLVVALLVAPHAQAVHEAASEESAAFGPEILPRILRSFRGLNYGHKPGDRPADRRDPALGRCCEVFTRIGPPSIPPLLAALDDADRWIRLGAGQALNELRSLAVPVLIDMVARSRDDAQRLQAVQLLGSYGDTAMPAADTLVNVLTDKRNTESLRREAASALGSIRDRRGAVVAALRDEGLTDDSPGLRRVSAWALGQLGPDASPAAPRLLTLALDASEAGRVREAAIEALPAILRDDPDRLGAIIVLLDGEDADLRLAATRAFKQVAPKGPAVIPELVRLLEDPEPEVRRQSAQALEKHGKKSVPEVVRSLGKNAGWAEQVLWGIGALSEEDAGAIVRELPACPEADRAQLVRILDLIGPNAVAALDRAMREGPPPLAEAARKARSKLSKTEPIGKSP